MATVYWEGKQLATAQVDTGSVDSVDGTPANNTFTVTIGGVAISEAGDTDVATTAGNLVTSLNASTHPYFAAITWANPSSGSITATADTAGVPFTAALTVSGGGTGTVTDFSNTTANTSPNDANDGANFDGGAVPSATDDLIIADTSVSLLWNLASMNNIATLRIEQSFTGKIGLKSYEFATSASATDATVPEYRGTYLTANFDTIHIGEHYGPGSPAGSSRIKIDNDKAGASNLIVHNTSSSNEDGSPAVMYLAANASADIEVRAAPGGVGIAVDVPGETATIGDVDVTATSSGDRVFTGDGCTLTNWRQNGGDNVLGAAANLTAVTVDEGTLELVADGRTVTTLTVNGGAVNVGNVTPTTLTIDAGEVDLRPSATARTITNLNHDGGTLLWDDDVITITNHNYSGFVQLERVT